jgi:outer membrane protein assembly factor BamB
MKPRDRALALLACLLASRSPSPAASIGYRGDGTGVYPGDCRPVSQWREYADLPAPQGNGGPDPAKPLMENVVWRAPLANCGDGQPIAVGKRLYVVSEPGWPEGADAPTLQCFDADTGREVWRAQVDPLDALSGAGAAEARALRRRYWDALRRMYVLAAEFNGAAEARRQAIQNELDALGVGRLTRKGAFSPLAGQCAAPLEARPLRDLGRAWNFVVPTWGYTCMGMAFSTPCSDGRAVYVATAYGCVAAYDLDGGRRWFTWMFAPGRGRRPGSDAATKANTWGANSPVLVGQRLMYRCQGYVFGLNTETGDVVWEDCLKDADDPQDNGRSPVGSLVHLRVDGTDMVVNPRGETYRTLDGRKLADPLYPSMRGMGHHTFAVDRERNVLFFGSGGPNGTKEFGDGVWAVKVEMDGPDRAKARLLWRDSLHRCDDETAVYAGGRLYVSGAGVYAGDGQRLGDLRLSGTHGLVAAGGRLWSGLPGGESCTFGNAPINADGLVGPEVLNRLGHFGPFDESKALQVRSMTGCSDMGKWYAWAFGRSYPFFSGNRVFIRTYDALYCIGNPAEPFEPSAASSPAGPR